MWAKAPGEKANGQGLIQYDLMLFFAMYIEEYRKVQQRDAQSILLTAILIAMFGNVSEVCQACNNNVGKQPPLEYHGEIRDWGPSPQTADSFVLTRGV